MTKSNYPYSLVIKYRESAERLKWMEKTLPGAGIDRWCWAYSAEFGEGYEIFFREEADYVLYCLKWS
jgi:hypothetical protein